MSGRFYIDKQNKKELYFKDSGGTDSNITVIIHNLDFAKDEQEEEYSFITVPMREICKLIWFADIKLHDYVEELEK